MKIKKLVCLILVLCLACSVFPSGNADAQGKGEEAYTFSEGVEDSYAAGGKLYVLSTLWSASDEYSSQISIYDTEQKKFERTLIVDIYASAIGADSSGRIYLGGEQLCDLGQRGEVIAETYDTKTKKRKDRKNDVMNIARRDT